MTQTETVVVIGAGLAGAKAVEALREKGFDGEIVLIGEEERLPYERPPLSKEFLAGTQSLGDFTVHPTDWYRDHRVDLRLGVHAEALDPLAHTVRIADRPTIGSSKPLLAPASRSRRPPIPGSGATGCPYLRRFCASTTLV